MPRWFDRFLALGAASGALSAAATFIRLGDVASPLVLGRCLGFGGLNTCNGIDASFYLFPGLIFGVGLAGLLYRQGRLKLTHAVVIVVASTIANAVAVFVCVALIDPLGEHIEIADLNIAIAGVVAGGVGGALLTAAIRALLPGVLAARSIVIASGLGAVVVAMVELDSAGAFLFYIAWQAGYAAVLGAAVQR